MLSSKVHFIHDKQNYLQLSVSHLGSLVTLHHMTQYIIFHVLPWVMKGLPCLLFVVEFPVDIVCQLYLILNQAKLSQKLYNQQACREGGVTSVSAPPTGLGGLPIMGRWLKRECKNQTSWHRLKMKF